MTQVTNNTVAKTTTISIEEALVLIARLQAENEELKLKVATDGFTGIYNRASFDEMLPRLLARFPGDGELTMMLIDLDSLKWLNSALGYYDANQLLKLIAQAMISATRPDDARFRFGGDEFIIVLPEISLERALALASKVHSDFAANQVPLGLKIQGTTSIGIAQSRKGDTVKSFLDRANRAVNQAKDNGKNRTEVA